MNSLTKSFEWKKIEENFKRLIKKLGLWNRYTFKTHSIAQEIQDIAKNYYNEETISREMPWQKDCISMTIDGVKQVPKTPKFLHTKRSIWSV